jgi:hypothetical protein
MTFDAHHYVPILKVKSGEKRALRGLTKNVAARVTPLLEIVTTEGKKNLAKHINTSFEGLGDSVSHFQRYFLDAREIESEGPDGASAVFERAATLVTPFVPVTGISREVDVTAALAYRKHGIAVRLTRDEFERGVVPSALPKWLATSKLLAKEVDLIVDLGAVEEMIVDGIAALSAEFLAAVPNHSEWRTLTLSASAFPRSMSIVDRNSHEFIDRSEWQAWKADLHAKRSELKRLPTFSDCAIQHPDGVEGFDPRIHAVSASIRYTTPNRWLLIKGESTRLVPPTEQFPLLAAQLVYGHLKSNFAGVRHCLGCEGMTSAANDVPNLGSPDVWRRLGTLHHITQTVIELDGLTWT